MKNNRKCNENVRKEDKELEKVKEENEDKEKKKIRNTEEKIYKKAEKRNNGKIK